MRAFCTVIADYFFVLGTCIADCCRELRLTPFQPSDQSIIEKTRKQQGRNIANFPLLGTRLIHGYHCALQGPKHSSLIADIVMEMVCCVWQRKERMHLFMQDLITGKRQ